MRQTARQTTVFFTVFSEGDLPVLRFKTGGAKPNSDYSDETLRSLKGLLTYHNSGTLAIEPLGFDT